MSAAKPGPDFSEMTPGGPVSPDVGAALKGVAERYGRTALVEGLTPRDRELIGGMARWLMRSVKSGVYEEDLHTPLSADTGLSEQGVAALVKAMDADRQYGSGKLAEDIEHVLALSQFIGAFCLIEKVKVKVATGAPLPFGMMKSLVDAAVLTGVHPEDVLQENTTFLPPTPGELEEVLRDPAFIAAVLLMQGAEARGVDSHGPEPADTLARVLAAPVDPGAPVPRDVGAEYGYTCTARLEDGSRVNCRALHATVQACREHCGRMERGTSRTYAPLRAYRKYSQGPIHYTGEEN